MTSDRTVLETLRVALADRSDVVFAYLFGSRSRGLAHPLSDVDVAVFTPPADEDGEWERRLELIAAVSRALGRDDVDVVLLRRAPPLLAERVARTGTLICSRDEPRRVQWIVETKSRYCDLRPLRALLNRALTQRVRSGRFGTSGG
ncbi:MAG: type VII toxin-antitoxin system MntA family adenylyltransferase antitoxin [Gemmatimonadota bacterium]